MDSPNPMNPLPAAPAPSSSAHPSSAPPFPAAEFTRFKACDRCRRKKIKCDGRVAGCHGCLFSHLRCIYTPSGASVGRVKPKEGIKSIEVFEERLDRIEQAVIGHLANRLPQNLSPAVNRCDASKECPKRLYLWKLAACDGGHGLGDDPVTVLQGCGGRTHFVGESSVFSIFLPRGMQWMAEKLGRDFNAGYMQFKTLEESWRPTVQPFTSTNPFVVGRDIFLAGEETPLPMRDVVQGYVNDYMDRINPWLPIFDRDQFMRELDYFYENGEKAHPAWVLALNMILVLGSCGEVADGNEEAWESGERLRWSYFRNACNRIPLTLFTASSVIRVQGLLVMALFLHETLNLESVFTLLGIVTSIGGDLGLHRNSSRQSFTSAEIEVRRNVFWTAFILDKGLSLRIGQPSTIVDSDLTVKLPAAKTRAGEFFLQRCKLARIQSKVSSLLCSPHAQQALPGSGLLSAITILTADLEEWRRGSRDMLLTTGALRATADSFERLNLLRLRLAYHGCCAAVQRPLCPAFDMTPWDLPPLSPFTDHEGSLQAAREIMAHVGVADGLRMEAFYSDVLSFVEAATVLFTNILADPRAERAAGDQVRIGKLTEHLRMRGGVWGNEGFEKQFHLTLTLAGLSRELVEKAAAERRSAGS